MSPDTSLANVYTGVAEGFIKYQYPNIVLIPRNSAAYYLQTESFNV